MKSLSILSGLLFSFTSIFSQQLLTPLDASSKVHFVIKNFGIKTGGDFSGLKGTVKLMPSNMSSTLFDVTVNSSTVDTDNSSRDKHLRGDDFFDVEKYPLIRIASTSIKPTSDKDTWLFSGTLTLKGVTKNISFPFSYSRSGEGYLFTGGFTIDRRDYTVGGGSTTMSDNVDITLSVFAK
jgi:polyisoprenoid-binding protein YceI